MHTAITLDKEAFSALMESKEFGTTAAAAESLGLSPSFFSQVLSGVRGVSILLVSRLYSCWGVPFAPGAAGSIYQYTPEELEFLNHDEEENLI